MRVGCLQSFGCVCISSSFSLVRLYIRVGVDHSLSLFSINREHLPLIMNQLTLNTELLFLSISTGSALKLHPLVHSDLHSIILKKKTPILSEVVLCNHRVAVGVLW